MKYEEWKGKRYIICKSRMPLWFGLNTASLKVIERRNETREEWKEVVLSFPESTNGCICKMCRYRRWYGTKEKK